MFYRLKTRGIASFNYPLSIVTVAGEVGRSSWQEQTAVCRAEHSFRDYQPWQFLLALK